MKRVCRNALGATGVKRYSTGGLDPISLKSSTDLVVGVLVLFRLELGSLLIKWIRQIMLAPL
jgi:hypothetical protein